MDPSISAAIASFIGICGTVLLMAATFYFGPQQRAARRDKREGTGNDDTDT